ncbi:WYL domain-containing protein [Erysipelothrix sp. HDW6A]|uniref:helix-turn-helix transcriptional regulator n=1 Tax=Erysipelothrix sp. HDW6A TaxID=2714928 RepID=UPI001407C12E|nr:WYL domain-containing protein [Erysipelothrix sp. HDW6A]QIK57978.1 WYL domain-containing protein [Erysipelothrix sp. HDW6A]
MFNKQAIDWLDVDFSRWGSSKDSSKFTLIKNAILESKELCFDYISSSSKQSQKCVHPVQLKYKSRDWYLIAHSVKDNALRTYRISRILNLRHSGTSFNESYSISDSEGAQTNVANLVELKLLVKETSAFHLYDEFEEEYISKEEDGKYRLRVQLPDDAWVISFLMSLGTDLLDIEPKQIKDRYKKTIMNLQNSII